MTQSVKDLSEDDLARFFHLSSDLLVVIDQNAKIQRANPALCSLVGREEQELTHTDLGQLMVAKDVETTKAITKGLYAGLDLLNYETRLKRTDGTLVTVSWCCTPVQGSPNLVYGVGKVKQPQRQINHASADSPTTLYDRRHFEQELINYFEQFKVSGDSFALLFIDMDNFTPINDYLGQSAGDKVLDIIAARIRRCVRDCDSVSRYGGDEFAIIVHRNTTDSIEVEINPLAARILSCIAQPIEILGENITVSASLGISYPTENCNSPQQLLDQADRAMYTGKCNGGNQADIGKSHAASYRRQRVSPISMYVS